MVITKPAPSPSGLSRTAIMLIGVALLALALTLYQWYELIQLRTGSDSLLCSVSETINCATVWGSPLAHSVHKITRIPIVAWGLAWSLVMLVLSFWLLGQSRKAMPTNHTISALRLTSGAGVVVSLLLLAYSISIKTFCPTCIVFYVLVAAAAYLVFARLHGSATGSDSGWVQPAAMSAGLLVLSLAVLLYPSLNTPREDLITAQISAVTGEEKAPEAATSPLEEFVNSLGLPLQQATSDSLAIYRNSPFVAATPDLKRVTYGAAGAPVHLIEWTDIRCPHCKNLEAGLTEIRARTEPNSWVQETRQFPLDSQCNSQVQRAGDGTSCLAAKLQICLAGSPDFARVRSAMFEQQADLTIERIWQIATQDPARRSTLEDCVNSAGTTTALQDDIDLAQTYLLEGTPLVVVNGRKMPAVPAAILGLIMAKGHDDDPGFLLLPAPDPLIAR